MDALDPPPDQTRNACCTEDEVTRLVHRFYERVRADELLGPIFERHVEDWDRHLARMVDFWSALLRGTRRFRGSPMAKHMALPGLRPVLFRRWLALFSQTTTEIGNFELKSRADERAAAIALRFWEHYKTAGHDYAAGGAPRTAPG